MRKLGVTNGDLPFLDASTTVKLQDTCRDLELWSEEMELASQQGNSEPADSVFHGDAQGPGLDEDMVSHAGSECFSVDEEDLVAS